MKSIMAAIAAISLGLAAAVQASPNYYEKYIPSTVQITTARGAGTGIIVDETPVGKGCQLEILTARHVTHIEAYRTDPEAYVWVPHGEFRVNGHYAEVGKISATDDMSTLLVELGEPCNKNEYKAVKMATSMPPIGADVQSLGYFVGRHLVVSYNRYMGIWGENSDYGHVTFGDGCYQGCSGGPVFYKGKLIGMITGGLIAQGEAIVTFMFFEPIDKLTDFLETD